MANEQPFTSTTDEFTPPNSDVVATSDAAKTVPTPADPITSTKSETTPEVSTDPASSTTIPPDDLKTALNALFQRKRQLLVKDITHAISSLGEACRLLKEVKGTFCVESGEAHFYYGMALLEQARLELSVFEAPSGGKSNDEEEDEDDEEAEGDDGKAEEEAEVNGNYAEAAAVSEADVNEKPIESSTAEVEQDISAPSPKQEEKISESAQVEAEAPKTNGHVVDDEKPSTSAGPSANTTTEGEHETDEEPSNLELAREVLAVAKVTFIKLLEDLQEEISKGIDCKDETNAKTELEGLTKTLRELRKKLAGTHIALGEVAAVGGQYPQAESEFRIALNILRDIEAPDSLDISYVYFLLGYAFSFDKKFVESIESFQKSFDLVQLQTRNLKAIIENKETAKKKGIIQEFDEEKKNGELLELLPEWTETINAMIEARKESLKMKEEDQQEEEMISRNSPVKNPNAPAINDISHLVKKKKKAEEAHELEPPTKKQCAESALPVAVPDEPDSSTTASAKNGAINGHNAAEDNIQSTTTME